MNPKNPDASSSGFFFGNLQGNFAEFIFNIH